MQRGDRLPEPLVNKMAYERMLRPDAANGVILDGYPRSITQAHDLDAMLKGIGAEVTDAVLLDISDEEAVRRLSGRLVCSNVVCEAKYHVEFAPPAKSGVCDRCGSVLVQRADDKPDAIQHRLDLYHKDTVPILGHYMERMVLREINGAQSMDAVEKDVLGALSTTPAATPE
jgi:adenylate kinase